MTVQIGFIAYRNDNGNFVNPQPIFVEIENKNEIAEMEQKPLRQLARWIFKRYKDTQRDT